MYEVVEMAGGADLNVPIYHPLNMAEVLSDGDTGVYSVVKVKKYQEMLVLQIQRTC